MSKLLELDRDKFIKEITDNWEKHKDKTRVKDLAKYLVDNSFTQRALGTLEYIPKDQLRDIVLYGDELDKETKESFGKEVMEFLEDIKKDIHDSGFAPWIKKQMIKQIDKQAEKIENNNFLEKFGMFGLIIMGIFTLLEMLFKNGYKDVRGKIKEFKEKRALKIEEAK
jgi:hypothetical protein